MHSATLFEEGWMGSGGGTVTLMITGTWYRHLREDTEIGDLGEIIDWCWFTKINK